MKGGFSFFPHYFMKTSFWKYLFATVAIILASMWTIGQLLLLSDAVAKKSAVHTEATSTLPIVVKPVEVATKKKPLQSEVAGVKEVQTVALPQQLPASPINAANVSFTPLASTITVTFVVEQATTTFHIAKDSTALDLMMAASSSRSLTFTGKEYSGLGTLITSINGKSSDQDHNDLYWIYSVNGKKATVGVSQYVLHEGDIVLWSYEPSTM